MIDECPVLAIAGLLRKGETVMDGLDELRVKESIVWRLLRAALKSMVSIVPKARCR